MTKIRLVTDKEAEFSLHIFCAVREIWEPSVVCVCVHLLFREDPISKPKEEVVNIEGKI